MTAATTITLTDWQTHQTELKAIRTAVFVEEQQVPIALEWDESDETAQHFLAWQQGEPVGCARLLRSGKITRMAVLKSHRAQGIGSTLLAETLQAAHKNGLSKVMLDAQLTAVNFYEKAGFTAYGDIFMDAGIPHIHMEKRI